MKKTKLKQGTLAWEKARSTRIGGSEVYDIVRYYASDEELQNCGINAEDFKNEEPFTTTWSLYHKIINDGVYKKEALPPEYAEYGHAVEPYGVYVLQKNRKKKLRPGEVYINDRLVASLDVAGFAEEVDSCEAFSYGKGHPTIGERFVCEQKSMLPQKFSTRQIPFKYIVQAQYQLEMTVADFYILQIMVLKEDTPFIRGKICQMSKPTRYKYLDEHMIVKNIYFRSNEHLGQLIKVCLDRFFDDVKNKKEPTAYISSDSKQNIIRSIHLNSAYNPDAVADYDLSHFAKLRDNSEKCDNELREEMQRIIDIAKENNVCKFNGGNGITAKFDKIGRFLIKVPEDYENEAKTVSE